MQEKSSGLLSAAVVINITYLFERIAYYGFRAIMVLFMVATVEKGGLGLSQNEALSVYGTFTAMVYLLVLVGAVFSDFVFGAFKTTLVGMAVLALASGAMFFADSDNILVLLGVFVLGSSLVKPGVFSLLVERTRAMPEKFDAVFNGYYLTANLGAAVSPLVVGFLYEAHGPQAAFVACLMIALCGMVFFWLTRGLATGKSEEPIAKNSSDSNMLVKLLVLLFVAVLSAAFWTFQEQIGVSLAPKVRSSLGIWGQSINVIVVVLGCLFSMVLWSFFNVSSWLKLALGLVAFAFCWRMFGTVDGSSNNATNVIVSLLLLQSIAELLFAPIVLSLLAQHVYRPATASFFGLYSLSLAAASSLAMALYGVVWNIELMAWGFGALAALIVIGVVMVKLSMGRGNPKLTA